MKVSLVVTKVTKRYLVCKGEGATPIIDSMCLPNSYYPGVGVGGKVTITLDGVPEPVEAAPIVTTGDAARPGAV